MKKIIAVCLIMCMLCGQLVFADTNNYLPYVIEPQFGSAVEFNKHGIAQVQLPNTEDAVGKLGVINLKGEKIFGFDGTKFAIRKNGLIMALGENDKAAFYSSDGIQLTDYIYETFKREQPKTPHFVTYHYLTDMHDGDGKSDLVPICRDGKFGFINSKGEETIEPKFDYVFGFYEGISKIGYEGELSEYGTYTNCKFGYVNEKGEVLPTGMLWAAEDFYHGYARIADGQYKVIDKNGQAVQFPTGVYEFLETNGNFILASDENGLVVLDMNGKLLSGAETGHKALFGKSFIIGQKQIADINGNIIYTAPDDVRIDCGRNNSQVAKIYKTVVQNRISVIVDGLVNQEGKVIIEPIYKGLREVAEGIFWTPDSQSLFDVYGNSIAEIEGYSVSAYNALSYKLLPVLSYESHKWGYIELPSVNNSAVLKYTENPEYHVEKLINTDYGTVVYGYYLATPHGANPSLHLVRSNGEDICLSEPVSRESIYNRPEHKNIVLSDDGRYLTFETSFLDRREGTLGIQLLVLHDAGTYYYKADLETGKTIETRFEPLDTLGEDVISGWAKPEVTKAIDLGFAPVFLRDNYKRNITRAEFAKMAMDFLSFSYGYSNATRLKTWSEYDDSKNGSVNNEFLNAYCHAKTDRNGNAFMSGDKKYEYNSNIKITMSEPFEKNEDFLYYESVIAAYNIGIVNGVSETEFNPSNDITRQEAAAMLMRVYKNYGICEEVTDNYLFADHNSIADWAKEDVYRINSLGVMQGVGDDIFAPLDNYTVEQAIATFLRLYEEAPVSRKNKNILPLLETEFEKEKVVEGNPAGRSWIIAEEKETVLDNCIILQGVWNMRHYGESDIIYVFYKSGGVTTLYHGHLTSDVEIDAEENIIRYGAKISDTFHLYNRLCGNEKVYSAGEYVFEQDIETGNILRLERTA